MAGSRILIVEDEVLVARDIEQQLRSLGYDPTGIAGTAEEALALASADRPQLALMDIRLPDGNGIELCRDLLSRIPGLRCLMLTSFTTEEAMLDAILAGAEGWSSS